MLSVQRGVYKPHDQLPSTRALANQLKLNVNTVKRAFQELEADGITYSVPGKGVFISESCFENNKIKEEALAGIEAAFNSAKAKGVTAQEIEPLLRKIFAGKDETDD